MQLSTSAAALALTVALGAAPQQIAHAPAAGSTLTKVFTDESTVELEDLEVVVDGEDMTPLIGDVFFETLTTQIVRVTDEFVEQSGGRVTELRRTFEAVGSEDEVSIEATAVSQFETSTGASPLEGSTVVFTWDDEFEEYTMAFAEDDDAPDEGLLDGLVIDMDLLGLLPADEVEEGDSWDLGISELGSLLTPGGNLAIFPEGLEAEAAAVAGMMVDFNERFMDEASEWFDGSVTCTYQTTREEEEASVAVIDIDLDFTIAGDMSALIEDLVNEMMSQMVPIEIGLTVDLMDIDGQVQGEGQLLWNVTNGHLHAFEFSGDYEFAMEFGVGFDAQGEAHTIEGSLGAVGALTRTVETE